MAARVHPASEKPTIFDPETLSDEEQKVYQMGRKLSDTGFALVKERQFRTARDMIEEGISSIKAVHPEDSIGLALVLHCLGFIHVKQARWKKAEPVLEQANLILKDRLLGSVLQGKALHTRGLLQNKRKEYPEAETTFFEASTIFRSRLPDSIELCRALYWLGNAQLEQGKNSEAEAAFQEAILISKKISEPSIFLGNTLRGLGCALHAQNKYADAVAALVNALSILTEKCSKGSHWIDLTLQALLQTQNN